MGKITDRVLTEPQDNIAVSYLELVSQPSSYGFNHMLELYFIEFLRRVMSLYIYRVV